MGQPVLKNLVCATAPSAAAFSIGPMPWCARAVWPRFPGLRAAAVVVVVSAGIEGMAWVKKVPGWHRLEVFGAGKKCK